MKRRKLVMLVEPMEISLSCRKVALELAGFRVLAAGSAAAALRIFDAQPVGAVAVLVTAMEIALPGGDGMGGVALVDAVLAADPDVKALLYSDQTDAAGVQHGAHLFLPHGCVSAAELIYGVKRLAKRRRGPKVKPTLPPPPQPVKALPWSTGAKRGPFEDVVLKVEGTVG